MNADESKPIEPKRPRLHVAMIKEEDGFETNKENNSQDEEYFKSYADISIHEEMLSDAVRTNAYRYAILKNYEMIRGKIVADIGAGTVFAIEASSMAEQTESIVEENKLSNRITVINKKAEDVAYPEKLDAIVSEWMGYCLLYESMLQSVIDTRDKWLKKEGLMFPATATLYIAAYNDEEYDASQFKSKMANQLLFGNVFALRKQRVYRDRIELATLSDRQIRSRFRFKRESIQFISDLLRNDLSHTTRRSQPISVEMQVMLALRFYASGSFLEVIGDTMGVDKATACRAVNDVTNALLSKKDQFIKWPARQEERDRNKQGFFRGGLFPGVIGCIDGTHVKIQAPSEDEPAYVNRKGWHSINVQGVCDHEGKCKKQISEYTLI
ncbi:PRMT6 [Mytilus edulis]|uniref:Protein arginine N-methyltransferase 6 n=1 Tax=Mytilus edulis TaxID=6550 RepID=A0A8S3T4K9_MYTED|nr:PRMT6 [Mytilus edulis]